MTIVDPESDNELMRLWGLITELSEELNRNRHLAVSLYTETGNIKNQALHSQSGFVLRRFNMDKSQEQYNTELERMNKSMSSENQTLAHDNKQLSSLIKEYEQGLEVVMSDFRNRAQDVQSRELSLIRHYEEQLLAKEEEYSTKELARSTAISESLSRMSIALRCALRTLSGEPVIEKLKDPTPQEDTEEGEQSQTARRQESHADLEVSEREPWSDPLNAESEHALEREIELARLERENEELKRLAGLLPQPTYPIFRRHVHSDSDGGEGSRVRSEGFPLNAAFGEGTVRLG